MFTKVGDEFGDGDFCHLSEHLSLLDSVISQIMYDVHHSKDPESDGLCDRGEYFIGSGFAAIQRYLVSTFSPIGIAKDSALKLGPAVGNGLTFVEAVNAGANYWKHLEEWGQREIIVKDIGALKRPALSTITSITKTTSWDDYTCSSLLAVLLGPGELKLSLLLPLVIEWRHNLEQLRGSMGPE